MLLLGGDKRQVSVFDKKRASSSRGELFGGGRGGGGGAPGKCPFSMDTSACFWGKDLNSYTVKWPKIVEIVASFRENATEFGPIFWA